MVNSARDFELKTRVLFFCFLYDELILDHLPVFLIMQSCSRIQPDVELPW